MNGKDGGGGAIFRADIEGLRGVAVLLVVLFHAGLALPGGFIGVDVFFVISGFLITGLLMRERETSGRIDLLRFYARRVRRLAPAAIVVLAVTLPVAYVLFNPLDRAQVLFDGAASALSVGNIRFAMAQGDYFAAVTTPSPFLHFWSLGVEEQFYLLWPALLLLAAAIVTRRAAGGVVGLRGLRQAVGVALGAVFVGSLAMAVVLTYEAPSWAFYSLPTRAFELAAGGLLAVAATQVRRAHSLLLVPLGWLGLAAIAWSGMAYDSSMAFPGTLALVPTLATVAVLAAGDRRFGPGLLLNVQPLRFLGRISYSLYLWHWPILVLAGLALGFQTPGLIGGLVLIGLSIGAATLSWAFVEEPFRRGLPAFAARPGRTVFAGVAAMLAVVVAANGMAFASNRALTDAMQSQPISAEQPFVEPPPGEDPSAGPDDEEPYDEELPEVVLPGGPGQSTDPTTEPSSEPTLGPTATPTQPTAIDPTASPRPTLPSSPKPTRKPKPTPDPTPTGPATPKPTSTIVAPPPPKPTPTLSDWALPADVRPSLLEARNDKERIWFERCLGNVEHTAPRAGCVYGNKGGSYTIALVGDSHGAHFFPAFEWVAQQRGWRLLVMAKVSCPFIDMPVRNILLKREYVECAAWNNAVVEHLKAAQPDLTVVSMSHWIYPLDPANDKAGIEAAAVARMIDRLPGRTVVLADSPHSKSDVPACLSQNVWDIRPCATSRSRALSAHGVMERKAAQLAGVAMIDLAGRICTDDPCQAVVDKMIVYRDSHHLTATFSRSLGPPLERLLDQVR